MTPTDSAVEDTLRFLESTPSRVRSLTQNISAEALRRHPEGTGWSIGGHHFEWSLLQHLCHWRDLEREAYEVRIERLQREVEPFLGDWDGDRIAMERDYDAADAATVLADFATARHANVTSARAAIASGKLGRGELEGAGPITVVDLLGFMRGHDTGHVVAVEKLRELLLGSGTPPVV